MNWNNHPRWAYVLVNLATLFWASNFALGRLLRNDIGPFVLTAIRFTIAALILTALASRLPAEERAPGRHWLLLLGMGLTGVFGFSSLLYSGLRFTTATNGSLINGTGPLVTGLLAALLLRESFTRRSVVGAIISLIGVSFIVSSGSFDTLLHMQFNTGDLFVLTAVVIWGLYSVMSRVVTRSRSALSVTMLSTWLSLPMLYPAAVWEWRARPPTLSLPVMLAVVYIGVFPSVVSFLAWNESVRRLGPGKVMAFYNMLPVFATLIGVLLLGEPFSLSQLAGGGLIISGSLISAWADLSRTVPREIAREARWNSET